MAAAEVAAALEALRAGGVIAAATDTVFGLLCDPRSADAVDRVYALKRRPRDLELTLLAAAAGDLEELVRWTPVAERLAHVFWPGPLSLVLPVAQRSLAIPRQGTTLSVRVPAHQGLRALLQLSGPLASTSANRHGSPPLASAGAVRQEFGDEVPVVVGNTGLGGVASTIIDCSVTPPRVLRDGPIDRRRLESFVLG